MRAIWLTAAVVMVFVGTAQAQDPGMRRRALQQQVMQRFMQNYRETVGLTDEQSERFNNIIRSSLEQRADIQRRERELWRALEGQMRPGVAANADSVNAIISSLIGVQSELVELARSDQAEYAEFLTPVQRAQLMLSMRRFQNNIQQIMQRRMRGGQPPPLR